MVLHDVAWHCMVLHGIVWYCMVLHGIAGGAGSGILKILCEISVAIVFGLENPTFVAKSHIFIPQCTEGGTPVEELFLKNTIFLLLP